jgi:hypothetical protein
LPADLLQAAVLEAERDAHRVGRLLTHGRPKSQMALPAWFLCGLGTALRLLEWEGAGIDAHLRAGLPSARQALQDLSRMARREAQPDVVERIRALPGRVTALFIERFAWSGRQQLDADVVLDAADETIVLDALADFLWDHRPQ